MQINVIKVMKRNYEIIPHLVESRFNEKLR